MSAAITILAGFARNAAFLLSLAFLYSLILPGLRRLHRKSRTALSGALFGLIAILGMLTPIQVEPGIIVDGRVVVVALASVFEGTGAGLITTALVMAFRSWLGGVGMIPGQGAILTASLLGALVHRRWEVRLGGFGPKQFILLGAGLAVSGLPWTLMLPDPLLARSAFQTLALPVGLVYPLETLLLGTLISHQIRRHEAEDTVTRAREELEQQVADRTGELSRSNVLLRDEIAERRRAEEAMRESQARLDLALRSARMGVWHWDITENRRYLDDQVCHLLGINPATFTGAAEEFFGVVHPGDRGMIKAALARTIEQGVPYESEYRAVWPDGSVHYITARGRLVRDDKGRPVRINGITWDSTERKRAEDALLARTQQLETVRAVTEEISRELDLSTLLELINRRAGELVGATSGTVRLWDEQTELLIPVASHGLGEWMKEKDQVRRLGEGLSGTVAQRREGMIVNDYRTSPFAHPTTLKRAKITAVLAEPLIYRGRLLGVLTVDKHDPGSCFTEGEREVFRLFAAQAAIAIENARLFEQVRASRERLQRLSRQLVEVQEAERRNIARELHDEIGQLLTGLKLLLEMSARVRPENLNARLSEAQALANELMARVHELSLDLRPAMLDDLGVLPALLWHFERFTELSKVQVLFRHSGLEGRRFSPEVETAAYRIVQEALTNVARHAKVAEVAVCLWADENTLDLRIEDRGAGFDPEATLSAAGSSGLAGMRERAALLGGRLTVTSTPGSGTQVMAELPLTGRFEKRRKPR